MKGLRLRMSGKSWASSSSRAMPEDTMQQLEVTTRFKPKELKQLHQQFLTIADRGQLLGPEGFRQSLGILGMVQDSILCQRLFTVFNVSQTGLITFGEFARGLNVLVKGTVDEKLTFAFAMTDIDGSGEITPEELEITVDSIMRIYAGIMGSAQSGGTVDRAKIRRMFRKLDRNGDGHITLEEYKRGMKMHPEFVASLRGQDLFEGSMQSAADKAHGRNRQIVRVSSSILKDVGEITRVLEDIMHADVSSVTASNASGSGKRAPSATNGAVGGVVILGGNSGSSSSSSSSSNSSSSSSSNSGAGSRNESNNGGDSDDGNATVGTFSGSDDEDEYPLGESATAQGRLVAAAARLARLGGATPPRLVKTPEPPAVSSSSRRGSGLRETLRIAVPERTPPHALAHPSGPLEEAACLQAQVTTLQAHIALLHAQAEVEASRAPAARPQAHPAASLALPPPPPPPPPPGPPPPSAPSVSQQRRPPGQQPSQQQAAGSGPWPGLRNAESAASRMSSVVGLEDELHCLLQNIRSKAEMLLETDGGTGSMPNSQRRRQTQPLFQQQQQVVSSESPASLERERLGSGHDRGGSLGSAPSRGSSVDGGGADQDFVMDAMLSSPTHQRTPGVDEAAVEVSELGASGRGLSVFGSGRGLLASGALNEREEAGDGALGRVLSSAAKGSTVFFGHKNWDLVINVMKGIQMAVGRSAAEAARPLNHYDYSIKEKYTLVAGAKINRHSNRGGGTAGLKDIDADRSGRSCRFVDYAPVVFAKLREHFGIRNEDYIHSIGPGNMLSNLMLGSLSSLAELGSEGKSGSFFYFTSDGLFMVKTVHKEEHKLLRNILHQYYYHMTQGADSLLCHIVGCHVLRLSKNSKIGANKIYFCVMQNVLNTELELQRRYDLKGSTVGRRSSDEARAQAKSTLKDLDLLDAGQKIRIGPDRKEKLMQALLRDAKFLEDKQLIDYSLLLGIHKHDANPPASDSMYSHAASSRGVAASFSSSFSASTKGDNDDEPQVPFFQRDAGGMRAEDGTETYVMGVIDFLTLFGTRKSLERVGKVLIYGGGVSVAPPQTYAQRFIKFMDAIVE